MVSKNVSQNLKNKVTYPPERVFLMCLFCASLSLSFGEQRMQNLTQQLLAGGDVSSSVSLQRCVRENFHDLENSVSSDERRAAGFISDALRRLFETYYFSSASGVISVFGCAANVINIVVFCKQKFADSVNISLLGLAISDLGALLTLVWMSVCFSPAFKTLPLTFDPDQVQYLSAGWPHVCFARITSYITAYITLERCLCVTLPLKVKTIITPRRTFLTISAIFLVLFASVAPVYFGIGFGRVNSTTVTYVANR